MFLCRSMMWKRILVTFLSVLSMSFKVAHLEQIETYRLPNNTTPDSYFVNLAFEDFDDGHRDFSGSVFIVIRVRDDTSVITLHSAVLITSVNLTKFVNEDEIEVAQSYDVDASRQLLLIQTLEETIKSGNLLGLRIEFAGKISTDSQDGVFISSYNNENGNER